MLKSIPQEPLRFSLGIRKRITALFLLLIFIILAPTLLFVQIWLSTLNEKTEVRLLEQSHRSLTVFFDSKKSLLEALVKSYSIPPDILNKFSKEGQASEDFSSDALIKEAGLDFIIILDLEGEVIGGSVDLSHTLGENIFSGNAWAKEKRSEGAVAGLWHDFNDRLWLLASSPLTLQADQDKRRMGTVVLGILIDDQFVKELSLQLGMTIESFHSSPFFNAIASNMLEWERPLKASWQMLIFSQQPFLIQKFKTADNAGSFSLVSLIRDIHGDAIGIFRIKDPVGLLWQEKFILIILWVTILILALFSVLLIKFFIQHISSPLVKIKAAMQEITSSGDLSKRLTVDSKDEMGGLIFEFNNMLAELEKMNKKIKHSSEELSILYKDLLDQKKFTSEIIATAPGIVLVLLPDGRVKFVNEGIERITGYKREETIGKKWFDHFLSFGKRQEIRAAIEDIVRGNLESNRQKEYPILTSDGQERFILWNHSVLQDKEGRVTAVIAIGQDITELKKIETELVKKMNDLEKFYKVTMDREKVVIQLKNEIRNLKMKLQEVQGKA